MSVIRIRFAIFLLCTVITALFVYFPQTVEAQFGINTEASLRLSPSHPAPNREVEVTLSAYSVNTTGATINWFVDGVEQQQYRNERSITVTTGEIGTSQTVRVSIVPQSGFSTSITEVIRPSMVDVIIEADTYVPSFYRGRALPSSEAAIRVIALPQTGAGGHSPTYSYRWEIDGKVLFGGPLRGKNVIETVMPTYNDGLLTVTVFDANSEAIAKGFKRLEPTDPEIVFYEENPLRGLARRAVSDTFTLLGEEVTIKAEPYFMNKEIESGEGIYEWRLNGQKVTNPNDRPTALTLRKEGGSGTARVELTARNPNQLLQYTTGVFNIFFE